MLVLVTWVFFRSADLPSAMRYLGNMAGLGDAAAGAPACSAASSTSRTTCGTFVRWPAVVTWGCTADVGLDAHAHAAEGRRRRRPLRARGRRADDAGVQPVHLLHLLMADSTSDPSGGRSREEIAKIEDRPDDCQPDGGDGPRRFLPSGHRAPSSCSKSPGRARWDAGFNALVEVDRHPCRNVRCPGDRSGTAGHHDLAARRLPRIAPRSPDISGFENALEDQAIVGQTLRPPAQSVLSHWLGAGNERVYIGRDGWVFYRPDVEYLTAHGFLERAHAQAACGHS